MSSAKHQLEKIEEYRQLAFKALFDIGAIRTCRFHQDFYYNTYKFSNDSIYALVTSRIKEENGNTIDDFKLLHEQIHQIMLEAASGEDECPLC